jgi:hypothetical protein
MFGQNKRYNKEDILYGHKYRFGKQNNMEMNHAICRTETSPYLPNLYKYPSSPVRATVGVGRSQKVKCKIAL